MLSLTSPLRSHLANTLSLITRPTYFIRNTLAQNVQPAFRLSGVRFKSQLAPRKVKWLRRHKGRVPIPTGGSIKGTTLAFGEYGLRVKSEGMRLSAKQLQTAEDAIKRKMKVFKGAKLHLRIFPDLPVCVKGNETRMGKGKGPFEFWAARAPMGRVLFEMESGEGVPIREDIARSIFKLAQAKLPVITDFITRSTGPRLGNIDFPVGTPRAAVTPALAPPVPRVAAGSSSEVVAAT